MEMREGVYFKSAWNLYESLNFMKSYFKKLLFGRKHQSISKENESHNIKNENYYDEGSNTMEMDMYSESDDCDEEMENWKLSCYLSNNELNVVDITQDDNDSAVVISENGKHPVKKIRLSRIEPVEPESVVSGSCDDSNINFFKSLLPYMSKLSDIQKLRVRSTIQNVILQELKGFEQ